MNRNTVIAVSLAAVAIGGGIYLSTRRRTPKRNGSAEPAPTSETTTTEGAVGGSLGPETGDAGSTGAGVGDTGGSDTSGAGEGTGAPQPKPCDVRLLPPWSAVKDQAGDLFLLLPGGVLYDLAAQNHRATLVKEPEQRGWTLTTMGPPKPGALGPGGQLVWDEARYDMPFVVDSPIGMALSRLIDWEGSEEGAEVQVLFGERIGSLIDPMDSSAQAQLADGTAPAIDLPVTGCIGLLRATPGRGAKAAVATTFTLKNAAPVMVTDAQIITAVTEAFVQLRTSFEPMAAYDRAIAATMRQLFPRSDYPADDVPESWEAYLNAAPQNVIDAFDRIDRLASEALDGDDGDEAEPGTSGQGMSTGLAG